MLSKTADTDIPSTILFDFSTDGAHKLVTLSLHVTALKLMYYSRIESET